MAASFFFYDLETSGINPRTSRIMQFAGQRTTLALEPVGNPVNILIALTPDVVPDPDAIMVTGITPQQTLQEGITEAEFLRFFMKEVATPDTIFTGYNTVRFDDEFMRFMLWRNFYDPYEWQWKDGRSRWDLLDVVRMTRALRPEGLQWPKDVAGKPTNRLELLTSANGLDHAQAHDALNDVHASIALARLLREKQPKLFAYLLAMRTKSEVKKLVTRGEPFVYSSGKYPAEFEKTTVALMLGEHPKKQGALVYDLRHDPVQFLSLSAQQLAEKWRYIKDPDDVRLPVKVLQYNRCPAVAPLGVLAADEASSQRIQLDMDTVRRHAAAFHAAEAKRAFAEKLHEAIAILDGELQQKFEAELAGVDGQLYDGFAPDGDRNILADVRSADPQALSPERFTFQDKRLQALLPLYKARNFPQALTDDERQAWDAHCSEVLLKGGPQSRLARYFQRLGELAKNPALTAEKQYVLEELQLYGQSIMPVDVESAT